jgi:hypothetical protein
MPAALHVQEISVLQCAKALLIHAEPLLDLPVRVKAQ